MTRRFSSAARVLLTSLCLLVAIRAHAAGPDSAAELKRLEHDWLRAAKRRDTVALDRILANDFVHIAYDGRVLSKADALRAPVANAASTETLSDFTVRLYGQTGIVTGLNTVTAANGTVEAYLRFTDIFIHLDGRWQAVSAQETLDRRTP